MRTISELLYSMVPALIIATGMVGTSDAGDQKYPVFVDCPDFITGSHCDSFFVQVRAELPDRDHPNNANIRYHLISGPGEIDERTGWWSWKWEPHELMGFRYIEIAASIGSSPEHTTPPQAHCRFRIDVQDELSRVLLDGQPQNSIFFVTEPGVHRFDLEIVEPDVCDTPTVRILHVIPYSPGSFYIENDQLVFDVDANDAYNQFQVQLVVDNGDRGLLQDFYFDTRETIPTPVFRRCPDDMIITACDEVSYAPLAYFPDSVGSSGILYEVVSGPGEMVGGWLWNFDPTVADIGQTYEVEIAARYGPVVTTGDENCRFTVTVTEQPAGIHPMDFTCGDSRVIPTEFSSLFRMRAFGENCGRISPRIVDVSPPFVGSIIVVGHRGSNTVNRETHVLKVKPDSLDAGQTFHVVMESRSFSGEHYTCEIDLVVKEQQPYRVRIETLKNVIQGQHANVDVVLEEGNIPMRGFVFVVGYNASAIAALDVSPGPWLEQCGWDHFEYRFAPYGPAPSGQPSGQIRISGVAEYGGEIHNPTCFLPDSLPATLFTIDFTVTNDRTFECDSVPIQFYWAQCGNNMIWPKEGGDLFISNDVYDAEDNLLTLADSLPSISGVPENCLDPHYLDRMHRLIDFQHGGIHIVCADSFDFPVGDINLNHVPYEIADLMIFTDYFLYGETVLTLDPRAQRQTSNINLDDRYLTIEDFHWFVQVHRGEVDPSDPYDTSSPNPAFFRQEPDGVVSVATPDTLGAAWLLLAGDVTPVAVQGMYHGYAFDGSNTRVLIYSVDGNSFTAGPLLSNVTAPLLEVQTCTYNGAKVEAIIDQALGVNDDDDAKLPDRFALMQNYPNPFNNSTVIRFDLPRASEVRLTVYNIIGQVVVQRTRYYQAGYHEFVWDGRSKSGDEMAGGVYFYRLQAGSFTETKKMLLLK